MYYKKKGRKIDSELENAVIEIFRKSRNNYGSRKIKIELAKRNITASKGRIRRIMDKYGLVSNVSSTEKNQSNRHKKPFEISESEQTEGFLGKKE